MGQSFQKLLKSYDYFLPKQLIAKKPASPRDSARLLVYKRGSDEIKFDTFKNLADYLPRTNFQAEKNTTNHSKNVKSELPSDFVSKKLVRGLPKNAVLVFNQTRVIPARLPLFKASGGKVEVLYLGVEKGLMQGLANKSLSANTKLFLKNGKEFCTVIKKVDGIYFLRVKQLTANRYSVFAKYGLTPLPPYMKDSPLSETERRKNYQTIFAKTGESVAAPTASLHFTSSLINKLKKKGIAIKFVRLDVNLGTFAKLTEEQIRTGELHKEKYFIDASTAKFISNAKKQARPIIAVGTTVVRTLESWANNLKSSGSTNLFIQPGYKFKIIDGLITNFHVPQSSLLMLVSALTGREKLLKIYKKAIENNFRFFSFGDGMLIT